MLTIQHILLVLSFVFNIEAKKFDNYKDLKKEVNSYCSAPDTYTSEEYGPISDWDVSDIVVMSNGNNGLFNSKTTCNPNISTWNVSSVRSFFRMFYGASSFNSDLSDWNVAGAYSFLYMFIEAQSFNSDLSDWNVSGEADFRYMFWGATSFYQDLTSWGPKATDAEGFCTNAVCGPTTSPTTTRSPTVTASPTIEPTNKPTPAPICANDRKFRLKKKNKKCWWIGLNEKRRKNICKKNKTVRKKCRMTCGDCCANDPHFRFKVKSGKMKRCSWIIKNNPNKRSYCDNNVVKSNCALKCENCKNPVV